MPEEKNTFKYKGFQRPNYTGVPNDLFDRVMVELTNSELRVLLYIMRRTFGFGKDRDNISVAQLTEGIVTSDGRQLDRGTGLSKAGVRRAVAGLVEKGLINAIRQTDRHGGSLPTTYEVRFEGDDKEGVSSARPPGDTGIEPLESHQLDPRGLRHEPHNRKLRQKKEGDISKETTREIPEEERDVIASLIGDFTQEMNDRAPVKSSITRALNLYQASMMDIEEFINAVYMSRRQTQTFTGAITGGEPGQRHKMPYFFAILEETLHLHAHLEATSSE